MPALLHGETTSAESCTRRAGGAALARREALQVRLTEAIAERDLHAVVGFAWTLYWNELYWFFRRRNESDQAARELVQDAFALLLEWWDAFDGSRFRGWLYAIARYTWLSHRSTVRRDQRRQVLLAQAGCPDQPSEDRVDCKEQVTIVLDIVARMDPIDQVIFEATFWYGCGAKEIADRLEAMFQQPFSLEVVRTRRHRIRRRVADHLARMNRPEARESVVSAPSSVGSWR